MRRHQTPQKVEVIKSASEYFEMTEYNKQGRKLEKINPEEIVQKVREMTFLRTKNVHNINTEDDNLENDGVETPDEIQSWREKVKNVLLNLKPDAFERLTQRLLRESGFAQVKVTGKTGDGGIDGMGIVKLNGIIIFNTCH